MTGYWPRVQLSVSEGYSPPLVFSPTHGRRTGISNRSSESKIFNASKHENYGMGTIS